MSIYSLNGEMSSNLDCITDLTCEVKLHLLSLSHHKWQTRKYHFHLQKNLEFFIKFNMLNVEYLATIFHILCVVSTLSLLWMCAWRYIQNDSTSLVDFRTFQQREKDIYPSFSLCFRGDGIYEQKKLNKTEIENYKNFLPAKS